MSAVLKFKGRAAAQRWRMEIARPDRENDIQRLTRELSNYYDRRLAEVTEHARQLGEVALFHQEQAERQVRDEAKAKARRSDLEHKFRTLVDEWRRDTRHTSSVDEMVAHPNYLKIIAMGQEVIPLLLRELKQRPDHWLVALHVLADYDPAPPEATFSEAVQAWLAWGRKERHI